MEQESGLESMKTTIFTSEYVFQLISSVTLKVWYNMCFKFSLLLLQGLHNISDYAVSFHYITPEMMMNLEYLVYRLKPYGILPGIPHINGPNKELYLNITSKH